MLIEIKKYFAPEDRRFIRELSCDTAFWGEPVEKFFDCREIIADALTLYYTEYEKESIFIAEIEGKKAGYLVGCKDIRRYKRVLTTKILPLLLLKSIIKAPIICKRKNILFLFYCAVSFFKKEFFSSNLSDDYPATLHINVDIKYRNKGVGGKLINEYINYLKKIGITGIHITTFSPSAVKFFEKNGFTVLHRKKITCFNYLSYKDIYRFIMGRKLLNRSCYERTFGD